MTAFPDRGGACAGALLLLMTACSGPTCPSRAATPPPAPPESVGAEPMDILQLAEGRDDRVLVLDGTPEIRDDLHRRLAQYTNTRSASLLDLSDDGQRVLVTTRFGETNQLHEVRAPLGARRQLSFNDEPVRRAAWAPGDPTALFYLMDEGGDEDHQLLRLDVATGRTILLTDGESKHATFLFSHDGSQVAYNGNARNGRDMDIYVGDGRSPDGARRVMERQGYFYPMDFSRDGEKLLVGEYISINDSRLWVVDLQSGDSRRITPEAPIAAYHDAAFGRSAEVVYVTTDREGEFRELYEARLDAPDAPWRPLTRQIPWNVEQIAVSRDARTIAITTNEDGYSVLRLLDPRSGRAREVGDLPRGMIRGLQFARRADHLGFTLVGASRTGDAYTYDTRRRRLTRWTESEVGGLDPQTFVEPSLVRFRSFDEREVPALYYRPRGDGPFPVVVYIHGGPESQSRPRFSALTQYLAVESGVAVLMPNVRGSDGYGKSYLLLDNGERREDSVRDIGALLDWIARQPELDQERVAVYGGSYGGYMVLASLVHFGERLRAGVDMVGISSFVTFLENTREYRRDLRRAEYGDEQNEAMRRHLHAISPLTNVGRIRSALFVAHGANDPRVPAAEAEQIVSAVRASGHDVWYMLARNEGHGFQKKENRDVFFELTVMFLEQHLGPRPEGG